LPRAKSFLPRAKRVLQRTKGGWPGALDIGPPAMAKAAASARYQPSAPCLLLGTMDLGIPASGMKTAPPAHAPK
jgi:hypothetical protein